MKFTIELTITDEAYDENEKASIYATDGNVSGMEAFEMSLQELTRRFFGPDSEIKVL